MPLKGLTFTGIGTYELDTIWPPGHPRYGECTSHMNASGDWLRGGQPTNRDGVVNYNDELAGGPSTHGVSNRDPATGAINATCNSWDFSADFDVSDWPPFTPGGSASNVVRLVSAHGVAFAPRPPGATDGLTINYNRTGRFSASGQLLSHTESTGALYFGGHMAVHVEVTPHGPWWVQVFAGSSLSMTACGEQWGGGELHGATWGVRSLTGLSPTLVLRCHSVAGTMGTRVGDAECPHPPPTEARARTQAIWLPWGE